MKKQLLTALLAFTPFFVTAQSTNAELLMHLKNSRNDIQKHLKYMSQIEKGLPQFVGKENVSFLSKFINDIHTVLPLTDFLYGKNVDIAQLYFEEICKMKQFNNNIENYESLIYANRASKEKIDIANEIKLISPIFIKHHKSYCSKHPNGYFKEFTLINLLTIQLFNFNDIHLYEMLVLQSNKYIFNDLLQKIDTKITELQKA